MHKIYATINTNSGIKTVFSIIALFGSLCVYSQTQVEVFVNSRATNAIKKYDGEGNYMGNFIPSGYGGLLAPEDILFHPDGSILVTGAGNTAIKRYDGQTGLYLGNFSTGYNLEIPSKMSIGWDSLIYVTQWGSIQNKVVRFDLNGNFIDEFTKTPTPNGLGHLWDADKNFYISVYGNGATGTIQKFDSLGNSLGTFIGSAILQGPTSIWYDSNGDLLVEDWTVGKVFRFGPQGQYINQFVTGLSNPEGIAFLPNGNLLIGDWGVDAVHIISPSGTVLGLFASGNGLTDPNAVKVRLTPATSVNDINQQKRLEIHPNPANDYIIFEAGTNDFQTKLFDNNGRLVLSNSNHTRLEIGNLPMGHYYLKLTDSNTGHIQAGRFIIVR